MWITQTSSLKFFLRTSTIQYGSKTCSNGSDLSIAPTPEPFGHVYVKIWSFSKKPPPFGRAAAVYLTSVSIFFRGIMVPQVLSDLEFIGWFWSSMARLSDLNLVSCNAACAFSTRNHTWLGHDTLPYTSFLVQ